MSELNYYWDFDDYNIIFYELERAESFCKYLIRYNFYKNLQRFQYMFHFIF